MQNKDGFDLENFDVISYFEDRDIEYHTTGKNVSQGWVNIECPFCSDPSWHCGVNLDSNLFHCWICGEKGTAIKLIKELEGCSWIRAEVIIKNFPRDFSFTSESSESESEDKYQGNCKQVLPKECSDSFPQIHLNYLRKRGFNPNYIIPKYNLKACYNVGKYRFRIIAPITLNYRIVSFTAMDVTKRSSIKYLTASNEESVIPAKECLYNLDNSNKTIILVEGITDVWRIGDGAVATLGKKMTQKQILLLHKKGVENILVLPDADAIEDGKRLSSELSTIFKRVELWELSYGDPADLQGKDLEQIRGFIKNF